MKITLIALCLGITFMIFTETVSAYTCPKGYAPTYNQAGKQSGCRKI